MKNPLIEMEDVINTVERVWKSGTPFFEEHREMIRLARLGLSLESSGWNLEAIPELIKVSERILSGLDLGISTVQNSLPHEQLQDALAKLKRKPE